MFSISFNYFYSVPLAVTPEPEITGSVSSSKGPGEAHVIIRDFTRLVFGIPNGIAFCDKSWYVDLF